MLPTSRNTTYIPGSKVKAQDLNDLQDCFIGRKFPAHDLSLSPFIFASDGSWSIASGVTFADVGYIQSTGAGRCAIPIPVTAGDVITAVTFERYGDGAADFTAVELFKRAAGGVVTDITNAATSVTNPGAAWADTAVAVAPAHYLVGAAEVRWIRFAANAANLRIGSIRVTRGRP
jgi:hypothetical protein